MIKYCINFDISTYIHTRQCLTSADRTCADNGDFSRDVARITNTLSIETS